MHVNAAAVVRDSAKLNPIVFSVNFIAGGIRFTGIRTFTQGNDMDIFDVVFCL